MTVHHGDCLHVMAGMPNNSVHAIVTDPPYGLGFMGKEWDDLPPGLPWARECLRVLKPGGHLLAFGGTRTWHRLAVAIEDAGFEMRDSIAWLYGSGFPKSRNVGKEVPAFEGWGTALKPAFEPIVVARKPPAGTVAANVLAHGTGALNIDATRVGDETRTNNAGGSSSLQRVSRVENGYRENVTTSVGEASTVTGRWPTNVVLDDHAAAELDAAVPSAGANPVGKAAGNYSYGQTTQVPNDKPFDYGDKGGASRFFPVFKYQAKAPTRERPSYVTDDGTKVAHPTCKPLELMRWLVRLVTPPGGTVLDPFAGSGATIEACILEGFDWIAIERDPDYLPLITQRIARSNVPIALALFDTEEPA